jgi:ATP-binding cassette subfamily B protein/ATP-binding cassette subfamily C protein/ATP-binding cassette subfamily B multidrug efflux pump
MSQALALPVPPAAIDSRSAIHLLRRAAAPDNHHLWHGALWLTVAALLEAAGPMLGKHFIDEYLRPAHYDLWAMGGLLLAMLGAGGTASVLRYGQLLRLAGVAMRSVRRLREEVFGHVLRLPMAFFDTAITGQLVSRVTNDTEQVKNLYVQVLFVMLDSSIVILGAFAFMFWLDARLAAMVVVMIPAVVLIVWIYQRWSAPAVTRARALRSDINAQMAESIAGMTVLQAANAEARFLGRFTDTNHAHYRARLAELRANAWLLRPMLDLLNVLLMAVVIQRFGARPLDALEIGVLYAFVSYIGRVVDPLIQITLQFGQLQQAIVAASRVNTLLEEHRRTPTASSRHVSHGAVALHDLSFGYRPDTPVLHDVSLEIPAGGFYGIVGHTGSGKSTLLSLLLRFYAPQSGRIEIDGIALDQIDDEQFRATVGLVPQDPFLLAASVRENIAMGRYLSEADIRAAADAARCAEFIAALDQGYDTPLGEGGARLSTGEKQLIAIARALAGKPRILLLDEATAHVDSETEQIVQQALDALRGQVTLIAIAHRLSTIRHADRIIVLNHGRIAETGNHDALMAIPEGIYQRLYRLQQMEAREEFAA